MMSFLSVKNVKSRKKVMEFFFSFTDVKNRKKVTESLFQC